MFKSGKAAAAKHSKVSTSSSSSSNQQFKTSKKKKNVLLPSACKSSLLVAGCDNVPGTMSTNNNPPSSTMDVTTNSRTLLIVFPTLEEFVAEREVLRNSVLPELQQYCSERDVDLECCTFFETGDLVENVEQFSLLAQLLSSSSHKHTTTVLCFVGDKYGRPMLPLELRPEEFNGIQMAALEISNDVKLLEQYYALDKTWEGQSDMYKLKPTTSRDPNEAKRLCETLQKSVKRAFEDKAIHQINEQRQEQFFKSFIELTVDEMLGNPSKHLFVSRRFQDYQAQGSSDKWMDSSAVNYDKVNSLKNRISSKIKSESINHLPFIFNLLNSNPTTWAKSKEALAYERQLILTLGERLKCLLGIQCIPSPANSIAPIMWQQVVDKEHAVHQKFLDSVCPKLYVPRPTIDAKLAEVVDKGMNQSFLVHIYGVAGSGKTAVLCRLQQLLLQRECFVVARFAGLPDSSVFANEIFRNILFKVYALMKEDPKEMIGSFHLTNILTQAQILASKLTRPLFILIDDIHMLKFGRVLSRIDKPLKELLPKVTFVFFSNSPTPLVGFPEITELLELAVPTSDQMLDIVKAQCQQINRKLGSDQLGILRQQLKISNGTLILAEIELEELLSGQTGVSASVDARLALIELRCGVENVRTMCQLMCCSPYGISALELMDGFRLRKRQAGMAFEQEDVLSTAPLLVLKHMGHLLLSIVVDGRRLWMFRYLVVGQAVRQRYLQSAGEIKLMNEVMVNIMTYPINTEKDQNDVISSSLIFPQPINRENGAINLRRVRFHWYYLLYTGNIESLKRLTLCSFDYLEATFRGCGLTNLLSIFEECLQQILDHDLLVLFEQVLLPAIPTLIRDERQFVSEFLNRVRYTRAKNSPNLNHFVEQAMQWTDNYGEGPLLVPLTCWIAPPKIKQVVSFSIPQWKSAKTIIQPTYNHQHLLIAGNELAPGSIFMYHIASQLPVKTFTGHQAKVSSFCISHDGQFFVSTALDGMIKIWNFTQTECIKTLRASPAKILCSLINADDKWIVVGSADSTAYVINIESGEIRNTFRDHTGPVIGLQLSSGGEFLVTGSGDFVVMVWDIELNTIIIKMSGLMAPVTCLAITSNDAFLAVACEDETLRVFSMVSSQELHELSGHDSRVNALVASSDDCQLFAATKGKVLVFDIHNGQLLEVLMLENTAQSLPVTSLKISDDNSFVLAACGDRIYMWNVNSIEREVLQNDQSTLTCVRMAPDEKGAGCGTVDGILAFWDLDVCQCLWTTAQQKSGAVTALDFTGDSLYLLSGSANGSVALWESSNGQLLKQLQIHNSEVCSISCFTDGIRVLSCDKQNRAMIWNLVHMEEPGHVEVLAATEVKGPLFVRLSDTVMVGQNAKNPKEVNIWSVGLDNRLSVKSKAHHNDDINCFSVNKTGSWLVTGSLDLSLKVWQTDSGFLTQVLVGHEGVITSCSVAENGRVVVSGGNDKQIIVWEVETGTMRRSILTTEPLCAVEISQDSSVVVSADCSGWLEAWHTETGQMLSSFNTHRVIEQLIMSIDGNRILVKLGHTAQLPIVCLHNTPANLSSLRHADRQVATVPATLHTATSSHQQRLQSATSLSSSFSEAEALPVPVPTTINGVPQEKENSGTKSGGPSNPSSQTGSTNRSRVAQPKSSMCLIL